MVYSDITAALHLSISIHPSICGKKYSSYYQKIEVWNNNKGQILMFALINVYDSVSGQQKRRLQSRLPPVCDLMGPVKKLLTGVSAG